MYKFLLGIVSILIKIIYRVRVNGIENFKDDEPIGEPIFYDEDGKILDKQFYKNGEEVIK